MILVEAAQHMIVSKHGHKRVRTRSIGALQHTQIPALDRSATWTKLFMIYIIP